MASFTGRAGPTVSRRGRAIAWQGGVLGLALGGVFIGESMFYAIPDGSKVAMVKLVEHLRSRGFQVFDAQMMNPHLERFGAYVVDSRGYDRLLQRGIRQRCRFC